MAYNNNSYSGYNRGYSGSGQSRRSVRGMAHSSARLTTSRSQKFRLKRSRMTISTVLTRSCAK
jgi:hypothetical protein